MDSSREQTPFAASALFNHRPHSSGCTMSALFLHQSLRLTPPCAKSGIREPAVGQEQELSGSTRASFCPQDRGCSGAGSCSGSFSPLCPCTASCREFPLHVLSTRLTPVTLQHWAGHCRGAASPDAAAFHCAAGAAAAAWCD